MYPAGASRLVLLKTRISQSAPRRFRLQKQNGRALHCAPVLELAFECAAVALRGQTSAGSSCFAFCPAASSMPFT
jgi:hypothetical protein